MLVALADCHLMVTRSKIDGREARGTVQPIQQIVYTRDGVLVDNCVTVKIAEVNAHPHGPISLLNKEQGMAIGRRTLADPTTGEQLIDLLLTFREFEGRHSVLAMLGDWRLFIPQPYLMLNSTRLGCTSGFCKHVRIRIKHMGETLFARRLLSNLW